MLKTPKQFWIFIPVLLLFASWKLTGEGSGLFRPGTTYTYSYYDASGNYLGKAVCRVTETQNRIDSAFSLSEVSWYNDTGATVIAKGSFRYRKDSASFISDLDNLVPPRIWYDHYTEVSISGSPLLYPLRPVKNATLNGTDGVLLFEREVGKTKMLYVVTDRKVEMRDTITIPAGTFPCWIISSTERIGTPEQKRHDEAKKRKVKEWYSPEYGIVKAEYRNKDGALEMVRLMTAFR